MWTLVISKAIQEQMTQHGQEPISFADVKDEIFDMVKPADPLKITLQDLISRSVSCGNPFSVVWDYWGGQTICKTWFIVWF